MVSFNQKVRSVALAAVFAMSGAAAQAVSAWQDYSSFWVMGDSLSDTGNVAAVTGGAVPGPAYYQNRFSNGPIWADYFSSRFEAAGKATGSAAFGGATAITNGDTIPDLAAQTGLYRAISAGQRGLRPLVALWFGGNDIGNAAGSGTAIAAATAAAVGIIDQAIGLLDTTTDFLILNSADVGATPRFQFTDPAAGVEATAAVAAFNLKLGSEIGRLTAAGGTATLIDLPSLEANISGFGILNTTTPCLVGGVLVCTDQELAVSQYFDPFHPTATVHRIIGEHALAQFGAIPIPGGAPLMLLGLGLVGLVARRRRA